MQVTTYKKIGFFEKILLTIQFILCYSIKTLGYITGKILKWFFSGLYQGTK